MLRPAASASDAMQAAERLRRAGASTSRRRVPSGTLSRMKHCILGALVLLGACATPTTNPDLASARWIDLTHSFDERAMFTQALRSAIEATNAGR